MQRGFCWSKSQFIRKVPQHNVSLVTQKKILVAFEENHLESGIKSSDVSAADPPFSASEVASCSVAESEEG